MTDNQSEAPEASTAEDPTKLPQAVLDEALIPDLSMDEFQLLGETVKIKVLTVRYQIEFSKTLEPLLTDSAGDLDAGYRLTALTKTMKHAEVFAQLVLIICKNDGKPFTLEQILNQAEVDLAEMGKIVTALAMKNEAIAEPMKRFFMAVLPGGKRILGEVMDNLKTALGEAPSTNTV